MAESALRVSTVTWLVPHYPWGDDEISGIFHRTQARALERLGVRVAVSAPIPWVPPLLPSLRRRWRRYADAPRWERDGTIEIRNRVPASWREILKGVAMRSYLNDRDMKEYALETEDNPL